MILFFPQWQGAGRGHRLDRPARLLFNALALGSGARVAEVPVDPAETLEQEAGIWGRGVILRQLTTARDTLADRSPERVFTLGGDCGIEVAPVAYLNARYENFALVWLDGHADLNTPESSPSATFHGMPLRVLFGEGDPEFIALVPKPLSPIQVMLVGVRDLDPAERDFIAHHQLVNLEVGTTGITARVIDELAVRGVQHVYIHLDLDALDPNAFPYMHYPAPSGFSVADVTAIVQALADGFAVVGMSITEYDSVDGKGLDIIAPLLDQFRALSHK